MVQNTTPPVPRRRGRPAQFDRNDVVGAALIAFWTGGYEGTSLGDLEAATGTDRSTLYNSFGGKRGIYDASIDAYLSAAETGLFGPLYREDGAGLDDIVEVLQTLEGGLVGGEYPAGCLVVNDMAKRAAPDGARRYVELLRNGLEAALARASDAGVVDGARSEGRAATLTATVLGINLLGVHADHQAVHNAAVAAIDDVRSWRLTTT